MKEKIRIGIIICDRYRTCAGGKCFRALKNREGAFDIYPQEQEVELVGYTTCDGCPGGNIEYAPQEMKKNGAEVIHLATGLVVGYPPCPYTDHFKSFIERYYGMKVVVGTHPIPEKYYQAHKGMGSWEGEGWKERTAPTLANEETRLEYN